MCKSIYEEVLEKIDVEFDAWDQAEHLELLQLVEHALEKAQKQEKLLELYKQAYDKSNAEVLKMFTMKQDEKTTLSNIIGHLDNSETVVKIKKELENE